MQQRNKKVEAVHYDATPVETIEIIESIVNREQIPRRAAFAIGNAVKYLCRADLKEFENWEDDVAKAENYLHRALTGKWK